MEIWYKLVNQYGTPFRGAKETEYIAVSSIAERNHMDIADLRDVIYARTMKKFRLKVDPLQLQIYTNQKFRKKKKPLSASWIIRQNYGKTKEKPLIVEAPSPVRTRSQELYMILLRQTFFRDVPDGIHYFDDAMFMVGLLFCYGCDLGSGMLRCMLLDTGFPSSLVTKTYLFRHQNAYLLQYFVQMESIHDVRNGLMLFQPIQKAFDDLDLGFLVEDETVYYLKIFNPNIQSKLLVDALTEKQRQMDLDLPDDWKERGTTCSSKASGFNLMMTFGDLEGKQLVFTKSKESELKTKTQPLQNERRPLRRCLYLHALFAKMRSLQNGWIKEENEIEINDFSVEGLTLQAGKNQSIV